MRKKIMPTTYLLVAILLCVVLHFLVPILYIMPSPWNLIGLIPLFFGLWINLSADRAFKKAETTVKPFVESNALIQDGVFRWSRNPMYLGFVAILLGISVLLRSLSPYIAVVVFVVLIDLMFIRVEEQMLEEKFGDGWKRYRSGVRK
ncbi:MAG: isoprenylcysteine carboxylmethyltransferase family protein [Anaerolineales bacterium]